MPVVKTPLLNFADFPKLQKFAVDVRERVQLYVDEKRIERRLKGEKKSKTPGLNYSLFSALRHAIKDSDVKSFEFDIDSGGDGSDTEYDGRYCVSLLAYDKGRSTLDKASLLSTPWKVDVKCPCGCKKTFKAEVTLPPKVLEGAMKEGKVPEPTVSVRRIGGGADGGDDEDE